jgi:hypothetical protein
MKLNDKLVGEFLGLVYIPWNDLQGYVTPGWWLPKESVHPAIYKKAQAYKGRTLPMSNWSNLMQVVEKIENLDCSKFSYSWEGHDGETEYNFTYPEVEICGKTCWIYFDLQLDPTSTITDIKGDSKFDACYKAVIEFIKWYNERSVQESQT